MQHAMRDVAFFPWLAYLARDADDTFRAAGGAAYRWSNLIDGNPLDDCSGVGFEGALERERPVAEKCLRTSGNQAVEIDFVVWPNA